MTITEKLTSVCVIRREGAVPADTAHAGWELYHDGALVGYFETKSKAEDHSISLLYRDQCDR